MESSEIDDRPTAAVTWRGSRIALAIAATCATFALGYAVVALAATGTLNPGLTVVFVIVAVAAAAQGIGGALIIDRRADTIQVEWRPLGLRFRVTTVVLSRYRSVIVRYAREGRNVRYVVQLVRSDVTSPPDPEEPLPCGHCGYNLYRASGDPVRCPECGGLTDRPRPGDPTLRRSLLGSSVWVWDPRNVTVVECGSATRARQLAERIAIILNFPVADFCWSERGVRRTAAEVGATLLRRLALEPPQPPGSPPPGDLQVQNSADGVCFELPAGGRLVRGPVYLILGAAGFVASVWLLLRGSGAISGAAQTADWASLGGVASFGVVGLLLLSARRSVRVTPEFVTSTLHLGPVPIPTRMRLRELREVCHSVSRGCIGLIGSRSTHCFGFYLSDAQRRWLRAALVAAIARAADASVAVAPRAARA